MYVSQTDDEDDNDDNDDCDDDNNDDNDDGDTVEGRLQRCIGIIASLDRLLATIEKTSLAIIFYRKTIGK